MKARAYLLGTGVKYDENKKSARIPVSHTHSFIVEEMYSSEHSWDRQFKTGFQRNSENSNIKDRKNISK